MDNNFILEPNTKIYYSIFSKKGLKLLNNNLKEYRKNKNNQLHKNKKFNNILNYLKLVYK